MIVTAVVVASGELHEDVVRKAARGSLAESEERSAGQENNC